MQLFADIFALIGLCATIIVVCFYIGYITYQPKCHTVGALFSERCK